MPDSWAKTLVPTIDFQAGMVRAEAAATYSLSSRKRDVCNPRSTLPRYLSAITTSSRAALPARSPRPLTVVFTYVAPALIPARALAVAMPKSLCVCISIVRPLCLRKLITL